MRKREEELGEESELVLMNFQKVLEDFMAKKRLSVVLPFASLFDPSEPPLDDTRMRMDVPSHRVRKPSL